MFKRALVAASVVAAFAAPAMAEFTGYGSLRATVDVSKADGLTQHRLFDDNSRLGFKGSDKLDNGLTAFWKVESRVKVDGNASTFGGRDQVVGIKGDKIGTITIGKTTSAYADATYLSPVLDSSWGFTDDSGLYMQGTTARAGAIKYENSFGDLAVAASYGDFNGKTKTVSKAAYSGVVNYAKEGKFNVGAAVQYYKDAAINNFAVSDASTPAIPDPTNGDKSLSVLVGGGVVLSSLTLSGHVERQQSKFNNVDGHQFSYGLGAMYDAGKINYRAQAIMMSDTKGDAAVADSGATHLQLSAVYKLSKQTSVLGAVNYLMADKNTSGENLGLPNGIYAAKDGNAAAVSVGLKVNF